MTIQGIHGSFHEMKSLQYFMHPIEMNKYLTRPNLIKRIFNRVNDFGVIAVEKPTRQVKGSNKTSLCFSINQHGGCLTTTHKLLVENKIDLTNRQSLPIVNQIWEHYFHDDIIFTEYHRYRSTLEQVRQRVSSLKRINQYTQGKIVSQIKP